MTLYTVVFPEPTRPASVAACTSCEGKGISGDTVTLDGDVHDIRCDVFCPTCLGCGCADHDGCAPGMHASDDEADIDDDAMPAHLNAIGRADCPSCSGRGWWAMDAWDTANPDIAIVVRVPCGCTEPKAVPVDDLAEEASVVAAVPDIPVFAVGDMIAHDLMPGFHMTVLATEPCETDSARPEPHLSYKVVDPAGNEDWLCPHDVHKAGERRG